MKPHEKKWDEDDMSPEAIASRAINLSPTLENYRKVLREIRLLQTDTKIKTSENIKQLIIEILKP